MKFLQILILVKLVKFWNKTSLVKSQAVLN